MTALSLHDLSTLSVRYSNERFSMFFYERELKIIARGITACVESRKVVPFDPADDIPRKRHLAEAMSSVLTEAAQFPDQIEDDKVRNGAIRFTIQIARRTIRETLSDPELEEDVARRLGPEEYKAVLVELFTDNLTNIVRLSHEVKETHRKWREVRVANDGLQHWASRGVEWDSPNTDPRYRLAPLMRIVTGFLDALAADPRLMGVRRMNWTYLIGAFDLFKEGEDRGPERFSYLDPDAPWTEEESDDAGAEPPELGPLDCTKLVTPHIAVKFMRAMFIADGRRLAHAHGFPDPFAPAPNEQ